MNFIKNNWGFILCALLCLGGFVVAGVMCSSASAELKSRQEAAAKEEGYLDSVAKKKLKLESENVEIAERNASVAAEGLEKAKLELGRRFHLEYTVPDNELEGLKDLKDKIEGLQKFLDEKGIEFDASCEYFTFDAIANATEPPHKDDLKEIFRQWAIIDIIVKTAAEAEVQCLDDLQRPLGLASQEESGYTYTPIEVSITASPEKAQKFVNLMARTNKNLFFLRTIKINAEDTTTEVASDIDESGAATAQGNEAGMPGAAGMMGGPEGDMGGRRRGGRKAEMDPGMMGGPGGEMEGGRRGRRRRNGDMAGPEMGGGPGMMGGGPGMMGGGPGMMGENGQQQMMEIPLKRQELLAFEPKSVQFVLRYDFIDFVKPEETVAEESEDSENQEQE